MHHDATRIIIESRHSCVSITVRNDCTTLYGRVMNMHQRYGLREKPLEYPTYLRGEDRITIRRA